MNSNSNVITGPSRHGRNLSIDAEGSIHDDATAQKIGFRGGTVAGDVHLDQFAPLLLEAFGPTWFETGSLSLYFTHATTDGEPVVAFVERPTAGSRPQGVGRSGEQRSEAAQHSPSDTAGSAGNNVQVKAWMETPEGVVVCQGTASVGTPTEPTALYARDLRPMEPSALRILAGVVVGETLDGGTMQPRGAEQAIRLQQGLVSEPLDWYVHTTPWGGPIASPLTTAQLLHWEPVQALARRLPPSVGMFGAVEIRYVKGPILLDEQYCVTGVVVAVSDSPKTEVLWYDTVARDGGGEVVATCRMMTRFVKASSPLYAP